MQYNYEQQNAISCIEHLEEHLTRNRHIIQQLKKTGIGFSSPRRSFNTMKAALGNAMRWQTIRTDFLAAHQTVSRLICIVDRKFCGYGNGWLSRSTNNKPRVINRTQTRTSIPEKEELAVVSMIHERFEKCADQLFQDYDTLRSLLKIDLDEWALSRKHRCHGMNDAWSVLLVYQNGKTGRAFGSQNRLFGWRTSSADDYAIRSVIRSMAPAKYQGGERPSLARGERLFAKVPVVNDRRYEAAQKKWVVSDVPSYRNTFSSCSTETIVYHRFRATIANYMRFQWKLDALKSHRTNARLVQKIMGINNFSECPNQVTTIFLGRPNRIAGDDYVVRAMWRSPDGNGAFLLGWCFLRRNWNDMYHLNGYAITGKSGIVDQVEQFQERCPTPTSDEIDLGRGAVDRSRRSTIATTGAFAGMDTKQKTAKVLWMLRNLPALTREDSYGVGNCNAGTEEFIGRLCNMMGIKQFNDNKQVDGKTLAKAWRKSRFVQLALFANVVVSLDKKMRETQAAIDAKIDAAIEARMEEEGGYIRDAGYSLVEVEDEDEIHLEEAVSTGN